MDGEAEARRDAGQPALRGPQRQSPSGVGEQQRTVIRPAQQISPQREVLGSCRQGTGEQRQQPCAVAFAARGAPGACERSGPGRRLSNKEAVAVGRPFRAAPRSDPYGRNYRIRLPHWVMARTNVRSISGANGQRDELRKKKGHRITGILHHISVTAQKPVAPNMRNFLFDKTSYLTSRKAIWHFRSTYSMEPTILWSMTAKSFDR